MIRPSVSIVVGSFMAGMLLLANVDRCTAAAQQAIIRVDPGRQPASGSRVEPTLERAISHVPALRRAGYDAIVIELAPGTHRLERAVRIDETVAGRSGATLIIRGPADGSARLSGSVPLRRVARPVPPGAPAGQRQNILAFALPQAAARVPHIEVKRVHERTADPVGLEIYDADGALTPARWPNAGWADLRPRNAKSGDGTLQVDPARSDAWDKETDLWIGGYLGADWSFEQLPATALGAGSGTLLLGAPPRDNLRTGARYYVFHALAELDQPGEWWRDAREGVVYLIPRPGADAIEVSVAEGLMEIMGAHDVRIENLTFERVRGDAVRVENSQDIVLENCAIRWAGVRGAVFRSSARSGVRRSRITDTGEGGIVLDGGDRASLAASSNFAEDNRIVRFSRLGRTEKYAVRLEGVGARVVGNFIAHAEHIAIRFYGNNHLIALNELTDVVNETSDAGAIYTGRDVTARGTVIRNNFLHDLKTASGFEVKGVYLDDRASGTTVDGNLFLRVSQPVFIGGGRDNIVVDNVFIMSAPAVFLDGRGVSWPLRPGGPPSATNPNSDEQYSLRAVPFRSPIWRTQYPALAIFNEDEPMQAKGNVIRNNLTLGSPILKMNPDADAARQRVSGNRTLEASGLDPGASAAWHRALDLARVPGLPPIPLGEMDRDGAPTVPADRDRVSPALSGRRG